MSFIRTKNRHRINFINPDPAEVDIRDIAFALARTFRFGGHSDETVAQHSCLVAELAGTNLSGRSRAEAMLCGLMHDAAEFAIGDVPTPLKRLVGAPIKDIENRVLAAILRRYRMIDLFDRYEPMVHWADRIILYNDALLGGIDDYSDRLIAPEGFDMIPIDGGIWSIEKSERMFLDMFNGLMVAAGLGEYR